MENLDGSWTYKSFRPQSESPGVPTQIAVPWAKQGDLEVTTDPETGLIVGTLQFAPGIGLAVSGSITPATEVLPQGVELTAEGLSSINRIRGYFVPMDGRTVVVGTVVAVQNDLAGQPDGTSGPFLLFPAAA